MCFLQAGSRSRIHSPAAHMPESVRQAKKSRKTGHGDRFPWPGHFCTFQACARFCAPAAKIHIYFSAAGISFHKTDGMCAIGGRDHYRETRTHSAELSPNSI